MSETTGTIELSVAEMTYGASALARTTEGQVAFVDDGLPGERVRAEVGRRRRKYLQTKVVEVLQASPARVLPPCPYVPDCGGCQWQHANYEGPAGVKRPGLDEH